jgi:6-pyruvoyltetrahydropterin/6-carboxytetrahydropterin synthase
MCLFVPPLLKDGHIYAIYQNIPAYKDDDIHFLYLTARNLVKEIAHSKCLYYEKSMFKIKIRDSFSSAHMLRGYRGDCERLHGHNYRIEVVIESDTLNDIGILSDFREVKQALKEVIKPLDHQLLNELPEFASSNPSAENIALLIYKNLKPLIQPPARLLEIEVWENDNCSACYSE